MVLKLKKKSSKVLLLIFYYSGPWIFLLPLPGGPVTSWCPLLLSHPGARQHPAPVPVGRRGSELPQLAGPQCGAAADSGSGPACAGLGPPPRALAELTRVLKGFLSVCLSASLSIFYFEIILQLQKCCKNSTQFPYAPPVSSECHVFHTGPQLARS